MILRLWLLSFCCIRFLGAADFDPAVFEAQVKSEQINGTLAAKRWETSCWLLPDRGEPFLKSHHPTDAASWEQQGLRAEHFMAHPEAIAAWEKALELNPSSQFARAHLTYFIAPENPSRSASVAAGLNTQGLDHLALLIHQQFWSGQAKWDSVKWAKSVARILDALKPEQIGNWNASFLIQATDAMAEPRIPGGDFTIPSILDTQTPLPTHGSMTGILRDRLLTYRTLLRSLQRIPSCAIPAVRRLRCIDAPTSGDPLLAIEALKIAIKPGPIPSGIEKMQLPFGLVPVDLPLLEEDLAGYEKLPPPPADVEAKVQSFKALRQVSVQDFPSAAAKVLQLYPDPDGVTAVMRQWWQRKLEIDPLPLIKGHLANYPVSDTRWISWLSRRCSQVKEREKLLETVLACMPVEKHSSFLNAVSGEPTLLFCVIQRLGVIPKHEIRGIINRDEIIAIERCVPRKGKPDLNGLDDLIRNSPWIGPSKTLRLTLVYDLAQNMNSMDWSERQALRKHLQETFPNQPIISVLVAMTDLSWDERTTGVLKSLAPIAADLVSAPGGAKEMKEFCEWVLPEGQRLNVNLDQTTKAVGEAVKDTAKDRLRQSGSEFGIFIEDQMATLLLANIDRFDDCWRQVWTVQMDLNAGKEHLDPRCLMPPNGYTFVPTHWIERVVSEIIDRDDPVARKKLVAFLRDDPNESICLSDRFELFTPSTIPMHGPIVARLKEEYQNEVPSMPDGDVSIWLPWWYWQIQDHERKDLEPFALWLESQPASPLRTSILLCIRLGIAVRGGDAVICQSLAKEALGLLPSKCSPGWRLNLLSILLEYEYALGRELVSDALVIQAASDFAAISQRRPRALTNPIRLNIARRLVQLSDQVCRDQAANLLPNQWMPEQKQSIFDLATESLQVTSLLEMPCRQVTSVARLLELAIRSGDEKKVESILAIQNGAILRVSGVWAMLLRLNRPDLLQRALASTDKVVYEPTDELWRADRWQKDSINAQTLTEDQRFLLQFAVEILPQTPRPSEIRGHYVKSDYQNVNRRCQTMTVLAQKRIWKEPAFITKLQQLCSTFFTPTTDALSRLARDNSLPVDLGDSRQVWGAIALGDPLPLKGAMARGFSGMNNQGLLYMVRSKLAEPLGKEKPWTSASIAHLRECVSVLITQHEKNRMFNPWGETSEWAFISFLVADKFKDFEELTKRVRRIQGTGSDLQFEIEVFIKTLLRMTAPKAEGGDREEVLGRLLASPWMAKFKLRNAPNIAKKKGDMQSILLQLLPALETQTIKNQDAEGLKSLAKTWTNLGQTAKAENCQKEAEKLAIPK